MRMAIPVPPGAVMGVADVGGHIPVPHVLEVLEQATFVLNCADPSRGPRYKNGYYPVIDFCFADLSGYVVRYIYNVALALGLKIYSSGYYHCTFYPISSQLIS